MSSSYVRTAFKTFVSENNSGETLVDLTGEYRELKEILNAYEISFSSPWMAIEFIPAVEELVTIGTSNQSGKYRETGGVVIHVVGVAKLGASDTILARAESLKNSLRGRRIGEDGKIIIESVTPPNFKDGATLQFDGGFTAASLIVAYEHDTDI